MACDRLEQVDEEFVLLDQKLASAAQDNLRVQLLMTLPGVNYAWPLGLLAALGDISRFRGGDHAACVRGPSSLDATVSQSLLPWSYHQGR